MRVDYHIHVERGPYEIEWLRRFWETAASGGISEIGVSEHCYRFKQAGHLLDTEWGRQRCTENIEDYLRLIDRARSEGMPVKLGVEVDYLEAKEEETARFLEKYPWDYVIGSVHWIGQWGFEYPGGEWEARGVDRAYHDYFEVFKKAARSGLFDILGHADLIKIHGYRPKGENTGLLGEVAKVVGRQDLCVEVSTGGLRKTVGEIYPSQSFLGLFAKAGAGITLSSDAHEPGDVGRDFDLAVAAARAAGFQEIQTFAGRRRAAVPLA